MTNKRKIILALIIYVIFMIIFSNFFLPIFYSKNNGNEMVDLLLADYSKSIKDIEILISNYGIQGRKFMLSFFVIDSVYIIISVYLFSILIGVFSTIKPLKYIPLLTGLFDTLENIIVLYTTKSLNMCLLIYARIFATIKGIFLFSSLIIILGSILNVLALKFRKSSKSNIEF